MKTSAAPESTISPSKHTRPEEIELCMRVDFPCVHIHYLDAPKVVAGIYVSNQPTLERSYFSFGGCWWILKQLYNSRWSAIRIGLPFEYIVTWLYNLGTGCDPTQKENSLGVGHKYLPGTLSQTSSTLGLKGALTPALGLPQPTTRCKTLPNWTNPFFVHPAPGQTAWPHGLPRPGCPEGHLARC